MDIPHLLLIQPQIDPLAFLFAALAPDAYRITVAPTGRSALTTVVRDPPDLVLFALAERAIPNLLLCQTLRAMGRMPIILAATADDPWCAVACLDAGADAVLTRPILPDLVLAQVRALLRRAHPQDPPPSATLCWGDQLRINVTHRWVLRCGQPVHVRPMEWRALLALIAGGGGVTTHSALLTALWGTDDPSAMASLHVLISQLRRKLGPVDGAAVMSTVNGVGYRLHLPALPTAAPPLVHTLGAPMDSLRRPGWESV